MPTIGDFLLILCDRNSLDLANRIVKIGESNDFPFYIMQKSKHTDNDLLIRSDHLPFWLEKVPAVTLTDTLENRYKYYHFPLDLPSELNYKKMAELVEILISVVKGYTIKDN